MDGDGGSLLYTMVGAAILFGIYWVGRIIFDYFSKHFRK